MLALLILIPLYLLALMAIIDALKKPKRRFMLDNSVTPEMKTELVRQWVMGKAMTMEHGEMYINGLLTPLCGWGYAYEMKDFNPPCQLELRLSASEKYTMSATSQAIVSEAVKALMRDYRKSERAIKRAEKAQAKLAKSFNLVPAMA